MLILPLVTDNNPSWTADRIITSLIHIYSAIRHQSRAVNLEKLLQKYPLVRTLKFEKKILIRLHRCFLADFFKQFLVLNILECHQACTCIAQTFEYKISMEYKHTTCINIWLFVCWVFIWFFVICWFFKINCLNKKSGIPSELNCSLNPDQARHFCDQARQNVWSDLDPYCLQRLSADNTSR